MLVNSDSMNFKNRLSAFLIVLLLPLVADADWFDEIRDSDDQGYMPGQL